MNIHGNTGKQNALKGDESKSTNIHIRCSSKEKASIVRHLKKGEKLSEFVLMACDKEVTRRES